MSVPVSGEQHERAVEAATRVAMGQVGLFLSSRQRVTELLDAYHRSLAEQGVRLVEQPKCKPCDGSGERCGDGYETDIGPCPDCNGTGYVRLVDLHEVVEWLRLEGAPGLAGGYRDAADDLERRFGGHEGDER